MSKEIKNTKAAEFQQMTLQAALDVIAAGKGERAKLEGVDLSGYSFEGREVKATDFVNCKLDGASFKNANLQGSTFEGCDMSKVDLEGADIRWSSLWEEPK